VRPSPAALGHLDAAREDVRARAGLALRWGDPEQWHLTLAFRADLPDGAIEDTIEHLASLAAAHHPMRLHLSGAGVFNARALWLGVGGDTERLAARMGETLLEGELRGRRRAHLTVPPGAAPDPRATRSGSPR